MNAELAKKRDDLFHAKLELTKQPGVVKEVTTENENLKQTMKNLKSERVRVEKELNKFIKSDEKK